MTCTALCSYRRLEAVAAFSAGTGEGGAWRLMSQKHSTTCTAWCVAGGGAGMCMCAGQGCGVEWQQLAGEGSGAVLHQASSSSAWHTG